VAGDIVTFMPKEKGTEKKTGSTSIFAGMDVDQRFIDFGSSKEMGDAYNDLIGGTYRYDKASVDDIIGSADFAAAIQGLIATNAAQWDMDSKKAEDRKARAKDVENLIVQFQPKEKTSGYETNIQKQKQQPKIKEKPKVKETPKQDAKNVFSDIDEALKDSDIQARIAKSKNPGEMEEILKRQYSDSKDITRKQLEETVDYIINNLQ
jgi:hypothetical protein